MIRRTRHRVSFGARVSGGLALGLAVLGFAVLGLGLAGVGLVSGGLVLGAGPAAAQEPGVSVQYQVSCLAENGRVDVDVSSTNTVPTDVEVAVTGLQPRERTVLAGTTQRVSITGRPDRSYDLVVRAEGTPVFSDTFVVSCDPPATQVRVLNDCVSGNGRVSVLLNNTGPSVALYAVTVGTLVPREQVLDSGEPGRVNVTGRPDGPITVTVERAGVLIDAQTIEVACDAILPNGVEALISAGCVAENGFFYIDVQNRTPTDAVYEITVTGLAPRSKVVGADRGARFIVTGRPDGRYDIVVRRQGAIVAQEVDIVVICDPIVQLVPVVRQVVAHDPGAFTQGFLIDQGRMFESTGAPAGFTSTVREVDPLTGAVLRSVDYGTEFFGEGLAAVGDRLIYLSWLQGVARVLDRDTFAPIEEFSYAGQGWGLCHDGAQLVMSDGSSTLTFRDATNFAAIGTVAVTRDGAPVPRLNELECVDGFVWANIWLTDEIVKIDPETGAVVAVVDASSLEQPRPASSNAVLNGIAHDDESGHFWLTGKEWPSMYEVELSVVSDVPIS